MNDSNGPVEAPNKWMCIKTVELMRGVCETFTELQNDLKK